jgi:hypothetical protein
MNRFSGRLSPWAARVTAFAIVTLRSAIPVWLLGFADRPVFIGATTRLLEQMPMLPPITVRFVYVLPFYFVLARVGALMDKALRGAIGGAARFYWWNRSVYWWSCSVYGGAARSFPQAIGTAARTYPQAS